MIISTAGKNKVKDGKGRRSFHRELDGLEVLIYSRYIENGKNNKNLYWNKYLIHVLNGVQNDPANALSTFDKGKKNTNNSLYWAWNFH